MTTSATDIQNDLSSVYLRHWTMLCNALKRRIGSHDLAEEAMQETWIRLSRMKGETGVIHDHQALLLRIAGNIAIDLARREGRHRARLVNDEALYEAIADSYPSPEVFAIDRDQLRFLALALAELPPRARKALLLSRCDGLSHREIALCLRVSESMVAKYLAQALRHCRDHFRAAA